MKNAIHFMAMLLHVEGKELIKVIESRWLVFFAHGLPGQGHSKGIPSFVKDKSGVSVIGPIAAAQHCQYHRWT